MTRVMLRTTGTCWAGIAAVVKTGADVGVSVLKLMGKGMLLTAEMGKAFKVVFKPLIWTGIAPCGKVPPAKMMLRVPPAVAVCIVCC